jgi:chitinase
LQYAWGARNSYIILVGRAQEKKPLVGYWSRWEDIIKINIQGIDYYSVDCFDLNQDSIQILHFMKIIMKRWVP